MGEGSTGLLSFLLLSALVIVLAYYSLRYVGSWQMKLTRGRRMRVLEGVSLGRDRQLLLVQVGKEVLLIGSSQGGVSLVHKLPEGEGEALLPETASPAAPGSKSFPDFESSIRSSLGKMRSLMQRDSAHPSEPNDNLNPASNTEPWRKP